MSYRIVESSGPISYNSPSPVAGHFSLRQMNGLLAQNQQAKWRAREARVNAATKLWKDWSDGQVDPVFVQAAMRGPELSNPYIFEAMCRQYPGLFRETMTTSDFSILTADILDRALVANYRAAAIPVMPLVKQVPLRDFRLRKLFLMDGMETPFSAVAEMEPVPQRAMSQRTPITYNPSKYEAGTSVSWEAVINDDLGAFQEIIGRLTRGAQRTVHKAITGLYASSSGPSSSLYTSGNANIINSTNGAGSNNPALSIRGLQDGFTVLFRQVDTGGDPILIPGTVYLVVPSALKVTAMNLKNQLLVDATEQGGTSNQRVRINNWIANDFEIIVDPYLDIVDTTHPKTSWYLFADPAQQDRYALEFGYLRGFDTPQLYQKMPNTMRVGGTVDPMLGDFQTMASEYKALIVFGTTIVDGRSTCASNGSGS